MTSRWGSFCFLVLYHLLEIWVTFPLCGYSSHKASVSHFKECVQYFWSLLDLETVLIMSLKQYMLCLFSCNVLSVNEIHRNPERAVGLMCMQIKSQISQWNKPRLSFQDQRKILSADLLHHRKWCDRLFRKLVFLLNSLRVPMCHISTFVILYFLF